MVEIIELDPWVAAILVLVSQVAFIYFRTTNTVYVAENKVNKAMMSSAGLSICWLIGATLGISSVINGQWQPLIAFVLAGMIGTYVGMKSTGYNKKIKGDNDNK